MEFAHMRVSIEGLKLNAGRIERLVEDTAATSSTLEAEIKRQMEKQRAGVVANELAFVERATTASSRAATASTTAREFGLGAVRAATAATASRRKRGRNPPPRPPSMARSRSQDLPTILRPP